MFYVYLLQSIDHPKQIYTGLTEDLPERLRAHNEGRSTHTNKFKPWRCLVALRFESAVAAREFEAYLKTGSGRAFAKRHFISRA